MTSTMEHRPWLRTPNVGELTKNAVLLNPHKRALITAERELSYQDIEELTQRVAGALRRFGIGQGDVVMIALTNDWRLVVSLFGALRTGATVSLANIKLGADVLRYIVEHSQARLLIADASLADKIATIRTNSSAVNTVLSVGGNLRESEPFDDVLARTDPDDAVTLVDPDDLALLMYTSGSTGRPKGVMLSHSNTWWQARSTARTMLYDQHDRYLVMGPLYHVNALWAGLLPMLFVAGSLVVLPEFDAGQAISAIHRHRVTTTSGTPSMFSLLLAEAERRSDADVSNLELLVCGSAPVQRELLHRLINQFGCEISESYGLTEGGANVLSPRWGIKKIGSTGLPVPDVEIRVVDPTDRRQLPPGEVGELWTRSPANALGYFKQPDITAEKFLPDGWLRSGDLVSRDDQGYVYFRGRLDDMINVGGENVYPKEVENILLSHPAVADVAVVPVAHAIKGQAPVAWVVLKPGTQASEGELRKHALQRGPAYAHPRRVFFRESLPISGTNKLDRRSLQHQAAELLPEGLGPQREDIPL